MSGLTPKSLGWKYQWWETLKDFIQYHQVSERASAPDMGRKGAGEEKI